MSVRRVLRWALGRVPFVITVACLLIHGYNEVLVGPLSHRYWLYIYYGSKMEFGYLWVPFADCGQPGTPKKPKTFASLFRIFKKEGAGSITAPNPFPYPLIYAPERAPYDRLLRYPQNVDPRFVPVLWNSALAPDELVDVLFYDGRTHILTLRYVHWLVGRLPPGFRKVYSPLLGQVQTIEGVGQGARNARKQ